MDKPCFELKGSLFTLSVLQLFGNDLSLLEKQLKERIQMAPAFFNHTPFVIDLHEFTDDAHNLDFVALKTLLLSLSMIPVGVKGAEKALHADLEKAGMAILAEAKTSHKKESETKTPDNTPTTEDKADTTTETKTEQQTEVKPELKEEKKQEKKKNKETVTETKSESKSTAKTNSHLTQAPTKIIKRTIRSGQQVYATEGDLVIIGSVSAGAEILAAGNIHVYGTLRGRVLAGIHGDQSATIFCHSLQAELYSIAGIYLLSDDLPLSKIGSSVQIYLQDDKLQIESI